MKKIYLFLLLCCLGFTVSAQHIFQPFGTLTFTGAASYCVGATPSPLTFTYSTCNSGIGTPSGAICSIQWYYNTFNSTGTGTATAVGGPIPFTSSTGASGIQTLNPTTSATGPYYYFCVISWTGGTASCAGGVAGSITSTTTQLVTINSLLTEITPGTFGLNDSVCLGSTLTMSNSTFGGAWSSSLPGTASVGASTGVVTGMSVGVAVITYALGGCYKIRYIQVNDTPVAITPSGISQVCIGATSTLSDGTPGGTWLSSASGTASIGSSSGIVTGGASGTARITYQISASGCYTTKVVSVIPNPAAIGGVTGICNGNASTLTDASGPGGTWSSNLPGIASIGITTGTVTTHLAGTATITYTAGSGCYATTVVTVSAPPLPINGSVFSLCAGDSTLFLSDPVPGGVWSTGAAGTATVGTTGRVTGISSGTVDITYTTPGCTAVSRNITVNPLPGPITGILSACNGLTTSLFNTITTGFWISSDTLVATIDSFSGILSGHTMGTTNVTYAITATGCKVTAQVTVNPLAPILGSDTICVGSQTLLTNIVGGGTWASSNPVIGTIGSTSGIIIGLVSGITFVVYTLPTTCSTSFFIRVLPPLPVITGAGTICSGSVSTLSDITTGGTWSTDNAFVASINPTTGVMSGLFPDTATITYSIYGCVTTTVVTVNPLPTPIITHDWTTHTLSAQNFYISYQWYDSSAGVAAEAIPGATNNALVIPRVDKYYRVSVTDANGCAKMTDWLFRNYTGVNELTAEAINVYPNPAAKTVFIESPVRIKAVINSIEGQILMMKDDAKKIDISNLPAGMYMLSLSDDTGQVITVRKLVKE